MYTFNLGLVFGRAEAGRIRSRFMSVLCYCCRWPLYRRYVNAETSKKGGAAAW